MQLLDGVECDPEHSHNGDGDNIVDFGYVLVSRPAVDYSYGADFDANILRTDELELVSTTLREGRRGRNPINLVEGDDINIITPSTPASDKAPTSQDPRVEKLTDPSKEAGSPAERGLMMKAILGGNAPDACLCNLSIDEKAWYLGRDYDPGDTLLKPDGGVRGGTLPALIERLTLHDHYDVGFNKTFLMTFRSFITLDEVFDGLLKRYYILPPPKLKPEELERWIERKQRVIRVRVINILKLMLTVDDVLEKEDVYILERIKGFASVVEKAAVPPIPAAGQLLAIVDRAQRGEDVIQRNQLALRPAPAPIMPSTINLLDIKEIELARQLTIMESTFFFKIRRADCQMNKEGCWGNNISALIRLSNKLSGWVIHAVLSQSDPGKRAAVLEHFIGVSHYCRLMRNFGTLFALIAGLRSPPIRRLGYSWAKVSPQSKGRLKDAERTTESRSGFLVYRTILNSAELPCVPFLGIFLNTFLFVRDGSRDIIQGGIINFSKWEKFAETMSRMKNYQSEPYDFVVIPAIQNFIDESLRTLESCEESDDWALSLSLEREPKQRDTDDEDKVHLLLQESGFL